MQAAARLWTTAMMVAASLLLGDNGDDPPRPASPDQQGPGAVFEIVDVDQDGLLDVYSTGLNAAAQDPNQAQAPFSFVYELLGAGPDDTLGATLTPLDPALRAQLQLPEGQGVVVGSLASGGPADQVGLKPNDILLSLDGAPLAEPADLPKRLKECGEKDVTLNLLRNGKPAQLRVRPQYRVTFVPAEEEKPKFYIGVQTTPADATLRAHLELPEDTGLVVNDVAADSPAQKAGLQKGDILLQIDHHPLPNTETLAGVIQEFQGKATELKILRAGKPRTVQITPAPRPKEAHQANVDQTLHARLRAHQLFQPHAFQNLYVPRQPQMLIQPGSSPRWLNPVQQAQNTNPQQIESLSKQVEELRKAVEDLKAELQKRNR
jgi:hypothetical protein